MSLQQVCPICINVVSQDKRYPRYVCNNCVTTYGSFTKNGIPIDFHNVYVWGGFASTVNGVTGNEHECYINNVRCHADESRFGGIVIQTVNTTSN
jgi:hypothetical protein